MEGEGVEQSERQTPPSEWFPAEEVKLAHGTLDIRDIRPDFLREGKDVPLVSILGFGTGNVALSRTFDELKNSGEHVIGVDVVGGGRGVKDDEGGSSEFNRQGELLYEYFNKYFEDNPGVEKVDFLTQSAGILRVLALVKLHPEFIPRMRNLIIEAPVGLYEKNDKLSPLRILKRFLAEGKRYNKSDPKTKYAEENSENMKIANKRMMRLWHPGDVIKALKEINALSRTNAYPDLEDLKAYGVKIAVIQGDKDQLASTKMLFDRIGEGYKKPYGQGINPLTDETIKNVYMPQDQKPPPIDVVRLVGGGFYRWDDEQNQKGMVEIEGGHGIQVDTPEKASDSIMRTKDYLNNPTEYLIENNAAHKKS